MKSELFDTYRNKKVLVTGHTGFKGGWLSQWLISLDAKVSGIALPPEGEISLFDQLQLEKQLDHHLCDIRDYEALKKLLAVIRPEVIFHLAAQPLVRESYNSPRETVETNVMGTLNLLEAVRTLKLSATIVVVTSDKSYENKEWMFGYRENDPMGGYDPYSASKGACEVLTASWRDSFFNPADYSKHGVKLATVRAGNVIGGGDWATDRIVPDCVRALMADQAIHVRNPLATRPWQHVLEPLGGYLRLGEKLISREQSMDLKTYCSPFNFGPLIGSNKTVESLVEEVLSVWGKGSWNYEKQHAVHEASLLNLTIDKAYHLLGWYPVWNFKETIKRTIEWYSNYKENPSTIPDLTLQQISEYTQRFIKNRK